MTSSNSEINFKVQKSITTKQNLILFANVAILACFLIDFFKYKNVYGNAQYNFQITGIIVSILAIVMFFFKKREYSSASYLISSYNAIANIMVSSIAFPVVQLKMFFLNEAFITRDVLLIFGIISVVGFASSKIHLIFQSLLLIGFVTYEAFITNNTFIAQQAPVYYIAIIGVSAILYFMLDYSKSLISELNETNTKLSELQKLNNKKIDKLERFYNTALTIDKPIKNELKKHIFSTNSLNNIAENISENLKCSRVSIWSFNNTRQLLHKKVLLENKFFEYEKMELNKNQFPLYFNLMLSGNIFKVPDVNNTDAIKEFSDLYLQKNKIKSILSCPLKHNNEVIGVLCCENQNFIKEWDEEEIKFIQLASVITSLHLVNENSKSTVNEKDDLSTSFISN